MHCPRLCVLCCPEIAPRDEHTHTHTHTLVVNPRDNNTQFETMKALRLEGGNDGVMRWKSGLQFMAPGVFLCLFSLLVCTHYRCLK